MQSDEPEVILAELSSKSEANIYRARVLSLQEWHDDCWMAGWPAWLPYLCQSDKLLLKMTENSTSHRIASRGPTQRV